MELQAPICKREKSGIHSCGFFPSEVSFPALYGGVDRLSTKAFLPWLDLVYPLPMQAPYSSLLVLPPRWGGDAPGTDLMASQIDLVPYHQHFCLISPVPLMPLAFRNVSQVVLPGGASILPVPMHIPGYSADCSRNGESRSDEQQPRCLF